MTSHLHNVILGQATVIGLHGITAAWLKVSDIAEPKLTATILVTLELGNTSVCSLGGVEADDTSSTGATAWLVLDLGLFNLSYRTKEFNQILIAGGPWEL